MRIVFNHNKNNHLSTIIKEINTANSVKIAVAFFKNSGFELLKPTIIKALKRGVGFEIYCGLNFGTTEATALQNVLNLFKQYNNAKLYLIYTKPNQTFHPKVWVFETPNNTTILSGSANFTSGGLDKNFECSIINTFSNEDVQVKDTLSYFEDLKIKKFARIADSLMIAQYSTYQKAEYEKQKGIKATAPTPEEINYDFNKLKKWHDKLKHSYEEYNKERKLLYRKASKVLDEIAIGSLTDKEFKIQYEKLVGSPGVTPLWKSGSIDRHKGDVFKNKTSFTKLVKFIRENKNTDASFLFEKSIKIANKINGVGPNIVCEIMMTYNPIEFANINKNPITVLINEAKVNIKKDSKSYNGEDYKTYCNIIKDIRQKLRLEDMLQVDTFFNEIYQIIKEKIKK